MDSSTGEIEPRETIKESTMGHIEAWRAK